jgi:ATP-dependent Clp protease protease subunit
MNANPFARGFDIFNRSLASSGATRGLVAKANGTEGSLYIYDVIGEDQWSGGGVTAKGVQEQLKALAGTKSLTIYVNSPGGSIFEGKAIFNQLLRFEGKKTVVVDGIAASAASFIAMAGDKIVTSEGATWMVHRAMGGAYGFEDDLRAVADVLALESANIAGIYAKRTQQSLADIEQWMKDETWMDAATAKARGFTDEIASTEPVGQGTPKKAAALAPHLIAAIDQTHRIAASLATMRREVKLSQCRNGASPVAIRASPVK